MSFAEIEAEIKKVLHNTDPETMQNNSTNGCSNANIVQQSAREITSLNRKPADTFLAKQTQLQMWDQNEGSKNSGSSLAQPKLITVGANVDVSSRKRNRRKKRNELGLTDAMQENVHALKSGNNRSQVGNDAARGVKHDFPFSVVPSSNNSGPLKSSVVMSSVLEHDHELKSEYGETEHLNVVAGKCSASASNETTGKPMIIKANEHALSSFCNAKQEFSFCVAPSDENSKSSKFSVVRGNEATTTRCLSNKTNKEGSIASVADEKHDFAYNLLLEPRQRSGEKPTERMEDKECKSIKVQGYFEKKIGVTTSKKQDSHTPASDEKIENEFEINYIFPLKKKSTKFPNAKYFCRLCEYHCDNIAHCQQHMKNIRHERLLSVLLEENLLRDMVPPSPAHGEAVTETIKDLLVKFATSESEQRDRFVVFARIHELIKQISKDATAAVYGSTLSLIALKDSDLNIDVTDSNPAKLLKRLFQTIRDDCSGYFCDVRSDFQSKVPAVYATVSALNLRVQIGVNNSQSVLTSRLLCVYFQLDKRARPLAIAFRHWAKLCRIDRQAEGTLAAYVFGLMTVYFLQQCRPPVLPVLHELFVEQIRDSSDDIEYILQLENVQEAWQSSAAAFDVGKLWIKMLRFYCLELNTTDAVVCIRESKLVKRAEKKWTSRKLAIEDPCICKRNVARSLSHSQMYEYIDEQLRRAYKFFGIMHDNGFSFDGDKLIPKKGPGIICSICQHEGHLKVDCPEEILPPLPHLPTLNRQYINIFNEVLYQIFDDCRPRERELKLRRNLLEELQSVVQSSYPGAKLCLFGSSCNGFGFQNSDLDISLTFADHKIAENLNCAEIIETLAKKLRRHHGFHSVFAITTAKVPIIKFKHSRSQLEGDISLYNTLAQHNTRMLQTYAEIDSRVRVLGYNMKVLAKSCEICDASRGSLSSYAYTLMVIYYLQQRKIPVVPVLQEIYLGRKGEILVDGWNAWFYEDLNNLSKVWSGCGKNQESIAELWIGLLRFYTEEFDIKEYVVSIRQNEPLTKFEKLWNGGGIAIEDPFNLDHNLGSALSRKMNLYILKVLRSARRIHGTPVNRLNSRYMTMAEYLFDPYVLTDAPPPNDRGCRRCGKIGHFVNECPLLKKGRQLDVDSGEKEEDEPKHEKADIKSIPTLIATKEPPKTSKADTTKMQAIQSSSVSSADFKSSSHSSGIDIPNSSHLVPTGFQGGRLGDRSNGLTTKPQSPLLTGPLVFHNSKISPNNTAISSTEVDQQSLNPGISMSPNLPRMKGQPPNAVPLPGSSALASGTVNVPNKPGQEQHIPQLKSYPLMNLSSYPSPGHNQMSTAQGDFSQSGINANHQLNTGAKGQPMCRSQHSQGLTHGQVDPGSTDQAQMLLPLQIENKVHIYYSQTDMPNQVQDQHGQIQMQGHAQGYQTRAKCHQTQNQTLRPANPAATDIQFQSHHQEQPTEADVSLALGNLYAPTSRTDQEAGMLKNNQGNPQLNPTNYNQFKTFPVGAIDSSFSTFMAHHYQQQYQQQCEMYQNMLQASLLQALGIKSNTPSANIVPFQSVHSANASVDSQFSTSPMASSDNNLCGSERSTGPLNTVAGLQHLAENKVDKSQKLNDAKKEPGIK